MSKALQITPATTVDSTKEAVNEDTSLTVVLAIAALGIALSIIGTAITPDWLFALTM